MILVYALTVLAAFIGGILFDRHIIVLKTETGSKTVQVERIKPSFNNPLKTYKKQLEPFIITEDDGFEPVIPERPRKKVKSGGKDFN